jgi:hypothetical protein
MMPACKSTSCTPKRTASPTRIPVQAIKPISVKQVSGLRLPLGDNWRAARNT